MKLDRRLPDFLIIGARRAGTTSLYDYLTRHPRIARAKKKELHFFDREYSKGAGWYRAQFPWWLNVRRNVLSGEATPYYLFHPAVPERVRDTCPDARFIALLRDPIDRAYSHHMSGIRRGRETLSFEAAIDAEQERLAGETPERLGDPEYWSLAHARFSYLSRGVYVDQLLRWKAVFPWERFLIVKSEDLYTDPGQIVRQAFTFLGVDPIDLPEYPHRNLGTYEQPISPGTRDRLATFYRPHNERLYELLGRDLGWDR